MTEWLHDNAWLGAPLDEWLFAALIASLLYLSFYQIWKLTISKLRNISERTTTKFDDITLEVLLGTKQFTLLLLATLIGLHTLDLPPKWEARLDHLLFITFGIQVAIWLNRGVGIWAREHLTNIDGPAPGANPVMTTVLSWILRIFIWSVALLTMLANMGVNITAFVASLGVGGVAVALAVQNILSDLFASLAIGLDKPFEVGDFVVFGDIAGVIERVGLKTTRIRSISGEQVICGNTELLKSIIHNYKRMEERRVVFTFGVTYSTPPETMEEIPGIVRKAVESSPDTRFDRAHFKTFGASSLDFEVVYFINTADFTKYMDIQQSINLILMKAFQAKEVEFAFPTMTLDLPNNIRFTTDNPAATNAEQNAMKGI